MRRFMMIIAILAVLIGMCVGWPQQRAFAAATLDVTNQYKIVNKSSGLVLGITSGSLTAGAAAVLSSDNGAAGHLWHFISDGGGNYKIENLNSEEILGISGGVQTSGANALQWADNGTADHLWQFTNTGGGNYKIISQNSGLALSTTGSSVVQLAYSGANSQLWTLVSTGKAVYVNPGTISGDTTVRDPSMIKASNGTYYVFSTSTNKAAPFDGIEMRASTDRIHFTNAGTAFTKLPSWISTYNGGTGDVWAPDISFHNNKYWLYFAVSTFGSNTSAIGLATSSTAAPGSWVDQGIVITSGSGSLYNTIDPCLVVDASGAMWLSFGSYWTGIYMIHINPTTGKQLASDKTFYHLAERLNIAKGIEASYIYPHGGFYYLFASLDGCCTADATYHEIVGRSTSITGPYTDESGLNMLIGGGTIILSTHNNVTGPGGGSFTTDAGTTLFNYQYHDANNGGNPTLGINLIGWNAAGWPFVK